MAVRVDKHERQERLEKTQDCWKAFVEKFFVGKENFLFPGRDEGGRIFSKDAIDSAIEALAGAGEGKFNEVMPAAFADKDDSAKYLFSHAVFVYELIITSKNKNVKAKERAINCLDMEGFAGSENLYLDGCSGIGNYLIVNKKPAIEYVLLLFKHLSVIAPIPDFNGAMESFCEGNYKDNESGIDSGIVNNMSSIILWYVAPDKYEPISAQSEKEAIANHFAYLIKGNLGYSEDMLTDKFKVNEALRMIRQKLEAERVEKISFYDADIERQWREEKKMTANEHEKRYFQWLARKVPSAKKYFDALKSKKSQLYDLARGLRLIDGVTIHTLLDIRDKNGFANARRKLEGDQEFKRFNAKGKDMYGQALHYYNEYLAETALDDYDSSDDKNVEEKKDNPMANEKQTPLNRIFYGPPGTGKTYHVIPAALGIIGNVPDGRKAQMEKFNELRDAGQIAMVTFHQNFSYEDFIEGIKPTLDSDDNNLSYEMATGIFKEIADKANENREASADGDKEAVDVDALVEMYATHVEDSDEPVFIGDKIKWRIQKIYRKDGEFRSFVLYLPGGEQSLGIRVIQRDYQRFESGEIRDAKDILPIRPSKRNVHGNNLRYLALFKALKEFKDSRGISFSKEKSAESAEKKDYVLIIDEINRGNISAIFGELITLLEDDKRLGREFELRLDLPYSKDKFGVPDNLHIIGTMNTADRSIAMLDTALRRRFHFVEMMPKPELLSDNVGGVDCRLLLEKINARIKAEYDREHQIGHAFLMGVEGIEDLKDKFQHKIVPLLQEYFFDDWEKIAKVLNHNRFIREEKQEGESADKKLFELLPFDDSAWADPSQYRKIYGGEETPGNE